MSFVPNPTQTNASSNNNSKTAVSGAAGAAAASSSTNTDPNATAVESESDIFKLRTFDVYWVEKYALMYKDGYAKVRLNDIDENKIPRITSADSLTIWKPASEVIVV